ncbi:hypothetical protein H9P43_001785 [Blastocladiella emersonii ATCC 22665]|nr:hypothetical protein H9P43_001785 [Blastocladiella emersonii ATCC 22665]
MNLPNQQQAALLPGLEACLSSLAESPPWQAVVRSLQQRAESVRRGNLGSGPILLPVRDVYLDLAGTRFADGFAALARMHVDGVLFDAAHGAPAAPSEAEMSLDEKHQRLALAAAHALLAQLPPDLRCSVAQKQLLAATPTSTHGAAVRSLLWRSVLPVRTDRSAEPSLAAWDAVSASLPVSASDVATWLRRTGTHFTQVYLALRDVYPASLAPAHLPACHRLFAVTLWVSTLPPAATSRSRGAANVFPLGADLWATAFACNSPECLLARLCAVLGPVLLPTTAAEREDEPLSLIEDPAAVAELVSAVRAIARILERLLESIATRTRRQHLVHLAGAAGMAYAGASADRMEQCLRVFFIGVLPWNSLVLLIDLLLCSDDPAETIEDVLCAMTEATSSDPARLGTLTRPSLLAALTPSPPSASPQPAAPDWLHDPTSATATSASAADRQRLEALADAVAFTQLRARRLLRRWQRTARGVGVWVRYLRHLREAAAERKAAAAVPVATAASKPVVAAVAADPAPAPTVPVPAPAAAPAQQPPATAVPAPTSTTTSGTVRAGPVPPITPAEIRARPLAALIDLVVGRTLLGPAPGGPAEAARWVDSALNTASATAAAAAESKAAKRAGARSAAPRGRGAAAAARGAKRG